MRTLSERMADWRWWLEQVAHFGLGAVSAALVAYWTPWYASAAFGAGVGMLREFFQNVGDERNDVADMIADVLFWSIGAVAMSLVF